MRLRIILNIVISFIFLTYIIFKIDMTLLFDAVLSVKIEWYIISFAVLIINSVFLALKYKLVMRPSGISQPLSTLVKINFICRFYSMFLTTAIGQSVIRWHISTKNQEGRLKFITVMLFERSTFFFALFIAIAVSLIFMPDFTIKMNPVYFYILLSTGLFSLFLFYFYLNCAPLYNLINNIIQGVKDKNNNAFMNNLWGAIQTFSMYYEQKKILVLTLFIALMWHFFFLWRVYLLVVSIQVPLNFVHISWMASLVLLIQALPISLNGIGIRETAYAFLFKIQDLPAEAGVLIGILLFSQMVLMAIIGGVLHLLSRQ